MKRIENALQHLQNFYSDKNKKTPIDIDLMLDYTREIYADLLDWKNNIEKRNEEDEEEIYEENAEDITHKQTDHTDFILEVKKYMPSGISFEPPPSKTERSDKKVSNKVIVEQKPVKNEVVVNKDTTETSDATTGNKTTPLFDQLFSEHDHSKKDIRKLIGINDQYLFLNELFANDKSAYENALTTLNGFDSYQQSYNWLWSKTALLNNWDEEDKTTQEFFEILKTHFSSK